MYFSWSLQRRVCNDSLHNSPAVAEAGRLWSTLHESTLIYQAKRDAPVAVLHLTAMDALLGAGHALPCGPRRASFAGNQHTLHAHAARMRFTAEATPSCRRRGCASAYLPPQAVSGAPAPAQQERLRRRWGCALAAPSRGARREGGRGARRGSVRVAADLQGQLLGVALFFTPGALAVAYAFVKGRGNLRDGLSRLLTEVRLRAGWSPAAAKPGLVRQACGTLPSAALILCGQPRNRPEDVLPGLLRLRARWQAHGADAADEPV